MKIVVDIKEKHIDTLNEALNLSLTLDEDNDVEIADAIVELIENCM